MQRSQSLGSMSSTLPVGPAMPALLTRTSSPPRFFFTSSNSLSTSERFATSAFKPKISLGRDASAFSSTSQTCTRAPCSRKVLAMTRPMPAPPAVTSTRRPFAETSIGREPLELEFPVFSHDPGAEIPVRLAADAAEAHRLVDMAGRREMSVRPEHELAIPPGAGERDALLDQPPAQPGAARPGLHQEQPQLCRGSVFLHQKNTPHPRPVHLRDPAALTGRLEMLQETLDDLGDQRLEARAPAVLLEVQRGVALDDPAHVARTVWAQSDFRCLFLFFIGQQRFHGAHRVDERAALRVRERFEHRHRLRARARVEQRVGLASLLRQRQRGAPRVLRRTSRLDEAAALKALQHAAEIAEVDAQVL